jgi:hypothetical protein
VFASEWIGENIYTMVRLQAFDPVSQREQMYPIPYPVVNLTTQYRSIDTIGSLYSQFIYDGILRHDRPNSSKKALNLPNLPLKEVNIIQFPSHSLELLYRPQLLNGSHYHLYSALLTVELTQYIAQHWHQQHPKNIIRIGIVCPYKAQATLVDKLLASWHAVLKGMNVRWLFVCSIRLNIFLKVQIYF